MEAAEIFEKRVRSRLEELDWSHADLARRLGVSPPMVTQTLTNGTAPRIDTLLRWASALMVTPQWLLGSVDAVSEADKRLACISLIIGAAGDLLPALQLAIEETLRAGSQSALNQGKGSKPVGSGG